MESALSYVPDRLNFRRQRAKEPCLKCVQVQAISDLSHEVTGVRMYSFFKEEDEKWQKNHGPLGSVRHVLTMWQRCGKLGHGARRGYIRSASMGELAL